MYKLAEIVDITFAQLFSINRDPNYNVTIKTIEKIYLGTKKEFGVGLKAKDYLDYECLKFNREPAVEN